jgi:hypothetical protein
LIGKNDLRGFENPFVEALLVWNPSDYPHLQQATAPPNEDLMN